MSEMAIMSMSDLEKQQLRRRILVHQVESIIIIITTKTAIAQWKLNRNDTVVANREKNII